MVLETTRNTSPLPIVSSLESVKDLGEALVELDVDDGSDHLGDLSGGLADGEGAGGD